MRKLLRGFKPLKGWRAVATAKRPSKSGETENVDLEAGSMAGTKAIRVDAKYHL